MHPTSGRRWPLLVVAALAACGPPSEIDAPPPAFVERPTAADSITIPDTYASAPVRVDLRHILREIERTIPSHIGSLDERLLVSTKPRTWLAIELLRGPLDIDFRRGSMTLTTHVAYRGRVWRKVALATLSASCGTGKQAPVARIRIRTAYRLTPDWRIRTASTVEAVERATQDPADECRATILSIDVTDKVLAAAKTAIQKQLAIADAQLGAVDVRGALIPVWKSLQQPLRLTDTTLWLALRPQAVGIGPVTVRDSMARATVTLLARPRIVSGSRPAPDSVPLPDISELAHSDTLVAVIDGSLTYPAANEILAKAIRGKRLWIRGRRIVIDDVRMSYIGRNRIALEVALSGMARGKVHLVGTPVYDARRDAITVPDLKYDIHTSNVLVRGITWLAGNKLRDELRRSATLPASAMLELARGLANQQITRTLSDGVRLSGAIAEAEAITARATAEGLRAQARGVGKLALDIRVESVFANTHIPRQPIQGIKDTSLVAAK